jgi:hypothetical protein
VRTEKISSKAAAALTALKSLQEDAKRKGLDKMTLDDINAEIKTHRRQKRRARKTALNIR